MIARTLTGVCRVLVAILLLVEVEATASQTDAASSDLVVVTAGGQQGSEARERYLRSARIYGYKVKFLGEGEEGKTNEGGKKKKVEEDGEGGENGGLLELLKKELSTLPEDKLVLFTSSVNALLAGNPVRVVEEFEACKCKVYVSADGFCWPDKTLEKQYPRMERGKRFLNAGGFVGRAGVLHNLLSEEIKMKTEGPTKKKTGEEKEAGGEEKGGGEEQDLALQELFTRFYLHEPTRNKYKMEIDHLSSLFQNLNGATGDVEVRWAGKESYLQNTLYNTVPLVVRGNAHTQLTLHNLGSYLARAWNPEDGCRSCWDQMVSLEDKIEADYPRVTIGVFVEKVIPFLEEFFIKLANLTYPKDKLHLYLHNAAEHHEERLSHWVETEGLHYASVKFIKAAEGVKEWHAKNDAFEHCQAKDCEYYLNLDAEAHLDNPFTLKLLIEQNRRVVAPLLIRPYKAWSNFWGAITRDGFYSRSMDYMDIIQSKNRGLWNVPYVSLCYLVKRSVLNDPATRPSYIRNLLDPDMAFCENLREKGVFMYVSNRVDFGHLVNSVSFNPERLNPELWEMFENRWDWEQRYLHPNYSIVAAENTTVASPCPDVFWFPLFTKRFAKEMIQTFEDFGVWSDGSSDQYRKGGPPQLSVVTVGLGEMWQQILVRWVAPLAKKFYTGYDRYDPRLEGGYESVPTIDIHMKQMRMEEEWLEMLRVYIQPIQLKVFQGYNNDQGPPRAIMNFMVRYKPDEQPLLRPHHDTSTYTINVALNQPGIDYEGGGCRFVRYNCSVTDSPPGWILMHPGRLTHLHEGLRTTKGTRYIIVSFVDP